MNLIMWWYVSCPSYFPHSLITFIRLEDHTRQFLVFLKGGVYATGTNGITPTVGRAQESLTMYEVHRPHESCYEFLDISTPVILAICTMSHCYKSNQGTPSVFVSNTSKNEAGSASSLTFTKVVATCTCSPSLVRLSFK